jgi:hypothetical protein
MFDPKSYKNNFSTSTGGLRSSSPVRAPFRFPWKIKERKFSVKKNTSTFRSSSHHVPKERKIEKSKKKQNKEIKK